MSFVSHVECTICGHHHDAKRAPDRLREVRPDARGALRPRARRGERDEGRAASRAARHVSLPRADAARRRRGAGDARRGRARRCSPLPRLAAHLGLRHLWGKDEGQNPTGSFKARGLGMAITRARTLGARGFIIPSAGNAGGAAAVYAARCGLPCAVIVPRGTPPAAIAEAAIAGAARLHDRGLDRDRGQGRRAGRARSSAGSISPRSRSRIGSRARRRWGSSWPSSSTGRMPDVLLYPTGGGTGLVGIPKGYEELRAMGWLSGPLPRFFAVQAEGCAPVVKAFAEGAETTTAWENPTTHAAGLRVPSPFAGRQMLRILRDTRRRRDGGERERDRGRPASAGAARGCLDLAGVGGARRRARHPQGPRRGPPRTPRSC